MGEHGDSAKVLAGGQSLMPVLAMRLARPDYLVDLNGVADLAYVREENGSVRIGALTRHHELQSSPSIEAACPLLWKAIPHIGHSAIRYRGTIGGSIAHADPAAELPAVILALDAELTVRGAGGSRVVPASDFFVTYFTTAVQPDELLTEVRIPRARASEGTAVLELARRSGDFALAGIAATVQMSGNTVERARLCAFGVDHVPRRLDDAEQILTGSNPTREVIEEAGKRAARAVEPESDIHASSEYRREMTEVLTRRALREALEDASTGQTKGNRLP